MFFLSENKSMLHAAILLHRAGFPWDQIGVLYSASAPWSSTERLVSRFFSLPEQFRCQTNICVAACLIFPSILDVGEELSSSIEGLISDVTKAVEKYSYFSKEDDLDQFLLLFRKIKAFYDAGAEHGTMGEAFALNLRLLIDNCENAIRQKLNFLVKLGIKKEEVGAFFLQNGNILDFDLEETIISLPEYLGHIGVGKDELAGIKNDYPHVMGRNKMINLPGVLRAVGLTDRFLAKLVDKSHNLQCLSAKLVMADASQNVDARNDLLVVVKKMKQNILETTFLERLEFLQSIGFGLNMTVARPITVMHGMREQFDARFDFLRKLGLEHMELCKMILMQPNLLNHCEDLLQKKVTYLVEEIGYPVEYLYQYPQFLCFDIENRVKPRYCMLKWLQKIGILEKMFSPATVTSYTEERFMAYLLGMHPSALKQWLELFSSRNHAMNHQIVLCRIRSKYGS